MAKRITLAEMRLYIGAMIHRTADSQPLESFWTPNALLAIRMARADIDRALAGVGLTASQVENGDHFRTIWEAQSLFWCLHLNRAYASEADAASLNKLDQRVSLASMPWTVDGVVVVPAGSGVRQSSSGTLAPNTTGRYTNPLLPASSSIPYPTF